MVKKLTPPNPVLARAFGFLIFLVCSALLYLWAHMLYESFEANLPWWRYLVIFIFAFFPFGWMFIFGAIYGFFCTLLLDIDLNPLFLIAVTIFIAIIVTTLIIGGIWSVVGPWLPNMPNWASVIIFLLFLILVALLLIWLRLGKQ